MKKNNLYLIATILLILIVYKTNFLRSLHDIFIISYNDRISNTYGFCEKEGIGYVNFIKKNFNIDGKIEIKNSVSDAIDIDFSEIIIDDIIISKANNDCIDFSYGKYKIKNLYVNYCKDKAVSLGERSTLEIKSAKIDNKNIGLVSKDSSILNIKLFKLQNVDFCASAYNKKQEFEGGVIFLNKNYCGAAKLYNDTLSKMVFH